MDYLTICRLLDDIVLEVSSKSNTKCVVYGYVIFFQYHISVHPGGRANHTQKYMLS